MKVSLIACVNSINALGKDGDLLYKISGDLRNFKLITKNSVVIMGRKTWESLPVKPLPNRINIVISSKGQEYIPGENLEEISENEPLMLKSLGDALNFC